MKKGEAKVPEQLCSTVSVDLQGRRIYVIGEVDEEMARCFAIGMRMLERGAGDVNLHVTSFGGEEAYGWAMHDLLKLSSNKTVFDGFGSVSSIMAVVMQGATVRRLAPNCQVMIHNGTIGLSKKVPEFNEAERVVREGSKNNARYYKVLSERSKLTYDQVEKACDKETFFGAEEAVRVGLADEVIRITKRKAKGRIRR